MLFKECKFKDKSNVRRKVKEEILINTKKDIPFSICNKGKILEYIDLLLNESEYDIKGEKFYYKYRWVRINLDINLLSKVTSEYINEHLDEFILVKHKK